MILYRCPHKDCGWTPNGPTDIAELGGPHRWLCANCGQIVVHEPKTDWPFAQREASPDPAAVVDAITAYVRSHGKPLWP